MCRECDTQYSREYISQPEHRARLHKMHVARVFGVDDYESLLEAQGGVCAICGRPERRMSRVGGVVRRLAVDHDHVTGQVRGLLCHDCNIGIGMFEENTALMAVAIGYLSGSATQQKAG